MHRRNAGEAARARQKEECAEGVPLPDAGRALSVPRVLSKKKVTVKKGNEASAAAH